MTDYDELLERAKRGQITKEEVGRIGTQLENDDPSVDPYRLLHILGLAQDKSYGPLVERYLHCKEDPMLARLALQILCNYWGDAATYVGHIHEFVKGVVWDRDEDVRLVAISQAGESLRTHQHVPLLEELIRIFESDSEQQTIREVAYCALARAVGRDWTELPPASRHFDLNAVDQQVVDLARARLRKSRG